MARCGDVRALSLILALTGSQALACDPVHLVEYDVRNGGYQIEINDIYLDHGGAQFASGGLPVKDWLLAGNNVATVRLDGESGDFAVVSICEDGSGRVVLAEASLTGRAVEELPFAAPDAPWRLYQDAAPVGDDGLLAAVEALRLAIANADEAAFLELHAAWLKDLQGRGRKTRAVKYELGQAVRVAAPALAAGLRTNAVLGGRVWEVYGEEFRPPIDQDIAVGGGTRQFRTGSFWMKIDGKWSVFAP